jgi:aspartate aminotransferase
MSFSPNVERLVPSATIAVSTLAKKLASEGRDIIDLSAGEPDFPTPEWVSDAAVAGIRGGGTRYTPAAGIPELRKAIAAGIAARTGREIDWNGIIVTAGAKQALFNTCFTLFGPADEVLIASPYWTSYTQMVGLARAEPVLVAGAEERSFRLTPADLDAAANSRTRGLMICSPNNPTGAVYPADELEAVTRWAKERGIWLISDEIYRQIHYSKDGSPATGILDLPEDALGEYILVDGLSKSFAMTGWRIGYSYSPVEVAHKMAAFQSHTTSNAATPSQHAALEAVRDPARGDAAVSHMLEAFRRRRDLVMGLMDERMPDFPYVVPEGAFYLFFRVNAGFDGEIRTAQQWCTRLLEEAGVALVPGEAFGEPRYVRMSFATSDAKLEEGIQRMAGAFAKL